MLLIFWLHADFCKQPNLFCNLCFVEAIDVSDVLFFWLQLYEEIFEVPFFKATANYFAHESQRLRENSDCSTFMAKVGAFQLDLSTLNIHMH